MAKKTPPQEPEAAADDGGLYVSNSARPFLTSGCSLLDFQAGNGLAEDQIILFRGDTGSGKSLLAVEAGANFLVKYPQGKCHYLDREDAFDEGYVEALGIPAQRFNRPRNLDTVEAVTTFVMDILDDLRARPRAKPVLVIIDSWDALTTIPELKRKMGDKTYGMEKAKLGQEFGRRVSSAMSVPHVQFTLIVVSQIKLGSIAGSDVVVRKTSGGSWLKFYPTQVFDLKTRAAISATSKDSAGVSHEREFGRWVEVKAVKNRRAGPNMPIMIAIRYNFGVDDLMTCVRFLADEGRADLMFNPATKIDNEATAEEKAEMSAAARKKAAMRFCTAVRRLSPEKYHEALAIAQKHARALASEVRGLFMPVCSKYGNGQLE